jgi:hypothetical protein
MQAEAMGLGLTKKRIDTRLTAPEIETAKNLRDLFNRIMGKGLRKGQLHRRTPLPSRRRGALGGHLWYFLTKV